MYTAFFDSFGDRDPWANDNLTKETGNDSFNYFIQKIVQSNGETTKMVWSNVGYSAFVWFCIWLCLGFGLKWTGRITYITMGLPILLLFIFLFKGISLSGSSEGIKEYIGIWDMSVLTDQPAVWSEAVSQIFFSIGITFGTMAAYGSHCPRGEPAVVNSCVIGVSNSMFSFVAGFAVFSALGYLSKITDTPVSKIKFGGFSLVFGTWPVVFGSFPGGEHWVRLLFCNLFMLGVDSAFSLIESPLTVAMDFLHKQGMEINKSIVSGAFCLVGFLCSLLFGT